MPRSSPSAPADAGPDRRPQSPGQRRSRGVNGQPAADQAAPIGIATVSFVSLGCPKNLVDSEKMLGLLAQDGIVPISHDPGDESFGGADAVVVNTCGFLEASKEESLGVIHEAIRQKEAGRVKRVVVAGCLVQRHRAKLLEWAPGIDALIGVFDRDRIVQAVRGRQQDEGETSEKATDANSPPSKREGLGVGSSARPGTSAAARRGASVHPGDPANGAPRYWIAGNALQAANERGLATTGLTVNGKDGKGIGYFEDDSARLRLTPRHYAYLRISEGCNQNCAFCTIPSIRGKMRSKPGDRVIAEARELIQDGVFELNLIGQDTTSYGDDIGRGLRPLLRTLSTPARGTGVPPVPTPSPLLPPSSASFANLGGLPALLESLSNTFDAEGVQGWIRLMYAYPSNFSDPIIDAFAALATRRNAHLLPYLDIPLQHASDRVLTLMRRNVTREQQAGVIRKLRDRIPNFAVRTTFISGFPGETEDDHRQLLEFVEEMRFEAVGVFEYSKEPGTVAGTMENDPALAVSPEIKSRRREEIMLLQQRIAFARGAAIAAEFDERRPAQTGRRVSVLIDQPLRTRGLATTGVARGGRLYQGRTPFQAPQIDSTTFVHSAKPLSPGELVLCVIVGSDGYDLVARPVADVEKRVGLTVIR